MCMNHLGKESEAETSSDRLQAYASDEQCTAQDGTSMRSTQEQEGSVGLLTTYEYFTQFSPLAFLNCVDLLPQCCDCLDVGVECQMADKPNRRAFPKGYTDALERQISALQMENRKLCILLRAGHTRFEQKESLASCKDSTPSSQRGLELGNTRSTKFPANSTLEGQSLSAAALVIA